MLRGLNSLFGILRSIESNLWDIWMNVDTAHSTDPVEVQGVHGDSFGFETNAHHTIRRAIRMVKPNHDDVVFVTGCAKGRAVCHFARLDVKKVVGVEISKPLAREAEINAARLRGRRAPIEILNADAATADYREGTVFFMSNPFGAKTLHSVLERIGESHIAKRKDVRVVYVIPRFQEVFTSFPWFKRAGDFKSLTGLRIALYKTEY